MTNSANPKNVLRLGLVSLLNDLGSEAITRVLPFYLSGVLGASMAMVGAVEGIAVATATLLSPIFGIISDRLRKRKAFVFLGYSFSTVSRVILAFAASWQLVAALKFLDRAGKGVRVAPRDALIADSSSIESHGRAFGIARALDHLGSLLGIGGVALWAWWGGIEKITAASWTTLCLGLAIPSLLGVALVAFGVREVRIQAENSDSIPPATPLPRPLKRYLAIVALFSLANSSDAFILLRAQELGFSLPQILGILALSLVVSTLTTLPAAALSDRFGRRTLIAAGWSIYALVYLLLGMSSVSSSALAFTLIVTSYGLFYGFTESVEKAWIADLAPVEIRGKAYGVFGLLTGLMTVPSSLLFGWAWDRWGSQVPFLGGAAIALLSAMLVVAIPPRKPLSHLTTSATSLVLF